MEEINRVNSNDYDTTDDYFILKIDDIDYRITSININRTGEATIVANNGEVLITRDYDKALDNDTISCEYRKNGKKAVLVGTFASSIREYIKYCLL